VTQSAYFEGPALRALAAGRGQPAFAKPVEPAGNQRDRIWELAETLHCSIVGTCLTTAEARSLLAKLGVPNARGMSEHHLHGQVVHVAGRKDGGGKLLQKALDRCHRAEIRRFEQATTAAEVRALWRESLERGAIPGAYWAAMTHPATDWALVQDIFGEVHMLSHLVGQSNRADIRRLRQLEENLAQAHETIAAQGERIRTLSEERDGLSARERSAERERSVAAIVTAEPLPAEAETIRSLRARLAREQAHAEALEEKLAVSSAASARLSAALATETDRRRALETEIAGLETFLAEPEDEAAASAPDRDALAGRTLLYVGGRPRHVAKLRGLTEELGGRLLSHDGGIEDAMPLLAGLVGQSDLVLFPVDCVSHEATGLVKRHCEARAVPFKALRSASLASFLHALSEGVRAPA